MTEHSEPHPLDQDWDDEKKPPKREWKTNAYLPLLKLSIRLALVSIAFILVATVLLLIAQPNSTLEIVSGTIHSICRVVLLMACLGVFVAYQIPKWNPVQVRRTSWLQLTLVRLILSLVILAALIVVLVSIFYKDVWILLLILSSLLLISPGILAVLAIWHRGIVRAFAIGALMTLLVLPIWFGSIGILSSMFFGRPNATDPRIIIVLLAFLFPTISGLICACYVAVLQKVRNESATPYPATVDATSQLHSNSNDPFKVINN